MQEMEDVEAHMCHHCSKYMAVPWKDWSDSKFLLFIIYFIFLIEFNLYIQFSTGRGALVEAQRAYRRLEAGLAARLNGNVPRQLWNSSRLLLYYLLPQILFRALLSILTIASSVCIWSPRLPKAFPWQQSSLGLTYIDAKEKEQGSLSGLR